MTITVTGVNDAPTAVADVGTTNEDTILDVAASGVLANDTDPDTGDVLLVSAVNGVGASVGNTITLASGALLQVNADGSYSFNPGGVFNDLAVGATATDSFTYTASDGNGGTSSTTVTITVTGVNDAPAAVADVGTTNEDTILNVAASGVLTNDTDPDTGDVLLVSAVNGVGANVGNTITLASGALLQVNADGSYSYNPDGVFDDLAVGATATDSSPTPPATATAAPPAPP